jgi:hypothetical protein
MIERWHVWAAWSSTVEAAWAPKLTPGTEVKTAPREQMVIGVATRWCARWAMLRHATGPSTLRSPIHRRGVTTNS